MSSEPGRIRNRGVRANGQAIKCYRVGKGWGPDKLATSSGLNSRTVGRAEDGMYIDLSSVKAIAEALKVKISDIAYVDAPQRSTEAHECFVDPAIDPSGNLLVPLRELHTPTARLRYFHRSLPYQLIPAEFIRKYNASMNPAVRGFFDEVGLGRKHDYDAERGQGQLELVMLRSDMRAVAQRVGMFATFSPEEASAVLSNVWRAIREQGVRLLLVDDKRVANEAAMWAPLARFVDAKSQALLGDRFVLRREPRSDVLVITDRAGHRDAFLKSQEILAGLVEYDPHSSVQMTRIFDELNSEIEQSTQPRTAGRRGRWG
jgi:hypothetical protein